MSHRSRLPNLTEGSILKSLIALSVPIIGANLLQTAYQLTDTFWVGRVGAEGIAAVSLSFPIIFLMISLGGGLAIAGTILVAHNKGKEDYEQIDHISAQTLLMVVVVSIILSTIGFFAASPLMHLVGADANVLPMAVSYLQITFIGMVFLFSYFVFQSLMRGVGDVKTPLLIVLGTVLLNFILDPVLIMGWGSIPAYGVTGAAMATIGTQGLAAIVGLSMLFSGKYGIHLKLKHLKPDFSLMKKMFLLGFPSSIEQSLRALVMVVMSMLVASFGTMTLAAYGVGGRIMSMVFIPAMGLSMATSTLVGQNIGAQKVERAEKIVNISAALAFGILTGVGLMLFFAAPSLVSVFIPGDIDVIESATRFVRTFSWALGFTGLTFTITGAFTGSGNTMHSMIISLIGLWILQFPLAYILSQNTTLGASGIWWAFPISDGLISIIAYLWFRTGKWKNKALTLTSREKLQKEVTQEVLIEEGLK
jgi:putative MATE family efflux protein